MKKLTQGLKRFFYLLVLFLLGSNLYAKNLETTIEFKKYTINNGLISNTVNSIIQDEDGYIWFCTDKGLCRFDGVNFDYINLNNYGIDESEFIYCFKQTRSKKIFFLSANYNYISYSNHKFLKEFIKDTIEQHYHSSKFFKDNNGDFWIEESNKYRNLYTNKLLYFSKLPYTKDIFYFDNNLVYFSNYIYHLSNDSLIYYDSLPNVFIGMKYFHYNNYTYFQPKERELAIFHHNHLNFLKIDKIDYITNSANDIDGNIWITGYGKGIHKLIYNDSLETYFENEHIINVFIDRDDSKWLMTQKSGIIYLPKKTFEIYNREEVYNFSKNINNKLYFGSFNSEVLEMSTTQSKNYQLDIFGYHNNAAVRDGIYFKNNIYFISDHDLSLLNKEKLKSIFNVAIKSCCIYNNAIIYASSFETYQYQNDSIKLFFKFPCTSLFQTSTGKLLYAKSNEIFEYDGTNSKLFLQLSNVSQILENSNYFIFATKNNGVYLYDKVSKNYNHLNTLNYGITNDFCNKIYLEDDTTLWICTNLGANKVSIKKNHFQIKGYFTNESGLSSNIINDVVLFQNTYYFCTPNGINKISKSKISNLSNQGIFKIVLHNSPIDFSVKYGSSIQIKIATIYYNVNRKIIYKYILIKDTFSTTDPNINISNLEPGNYNLRVWAINSNHIQSSNVLQIPIHIKPLFYQTIYFYLLLGLILISIIAYVLYVYFNSIKTKSKIAELQTLSLQSQMNPHFIFNALNSINSFIYSNNRNEANIYLSKISLLIRKSLDYSTTKCILLYDEINLLKNYLEIEKMRFGDKLEYNIKIADNIETEDIEVPPFFTQIMAENAIIHGISKIDKVGFIEIEFCVNDGLLIYSVKDNGKGLYTKANIAHKSKGLKLLNQRIQIFNKNTIENVIVENLIENNEIVGAISTLTLKID